MTELPSGQRGHTARRDRSISAPHAALLIDFDNVTMGIRSDLQNQLRRLLNSDIIKGNVSVQRAYADWRRYPQYIVPLSEASIDLIFAPAFGANKKNATDIRLAIDALELIFTRPEIGVFILLSGDSDFSALVLKLKEYGKYVIGVGIRESSSDLLIQNCDEYYSYNELTGLSREGAGETVRRDPWELVVEAARHMETDGDVMRSDRLKQVMQSLDPNFDERDAGYNRFSKFVVAAGQRGLLTLSRMDNGQYAVAVGPNANVPPSEEPATQKSGPQVTVTERKAVAKSAKPAEQARSTNLVLSDIFELLRRSLQEIGAVGAQATDAEHARQKMIELVGDGSDPVFDGRRFPRMLRQAHDAGLIDLIKSDAGGYQLRLNETADATEDVTPGPETAGGRAAEPGTSPEEPAGKPVKKKRTTRRKTAGTKAVQPGKPETTAVAEAETENGGAEGQQAQDAPPADGSAPATAKKVSKARTTKRRTAKRKSTRTTKPKDEGTEREESPLATSDTPEESASEAAPKRTGKRTRSPASRSSRSKARTSSKTSEPDGSDGQLAVADSPAGTKQKVEGPGEPTAKRNPRFRRGSRGAAPRAGPASPEPTDGEAAATARGPGVPSQQFQGRRSLGVRKGSRHGSAAAAPKVADARSDTAAPTSEAVPPAVVEPTPAVGPETVASTNEADLDNGERRHGGGLFQRISAVLQRAVQGDGESDR